MIKALKYRIEKVKYRLKDFKIISINKYRVIKIILVNYYKLENL